MTKKATVEFLIPEGVNLPEDQIALLLRDALHEFARRGSAGNPPRIDVDSYVDKRYGSNKYFSTKMIEEKKEEVRTRVEFATEAVLQKVTVTDCLTNDDGETLECTYGQPGANVDSNCGKPATILTPHGYRCEEHK